MTSRIGINQTLDFAVQSQMPGNSPSSFSLNPELLMHMLKVN